jgi:hypothetical protein
MGLMLLLELTLKMAMTAAIVVVASVVAERTGPFICAIIAALPTAAGAVYSCGLRTDRHRDCCDQTSDGRQAAMIRREEPGQ